MKFYLIRKEVIVPKNYHIIIPCNYIQNYVPMSWLINITNEKLKECDPYTYIFSNFQHWEINHEIEIPIWAFLKPKHTFITTGNFANGDEKGCNEFELNEYDLMYIKLMGWMI